MEKLTIALKLLDHVYHGCKKGTSCIPHCVNLRRHMAHASTCKAKKCQKCRHIFWFVRMHVKLSCEYPWKCKVPGCNSHEIVVEELVDMGLCRSFLKTQFA